MATPERMLPSLSIITEGGVFVIHYFLEGSDIHFWYGKGKKFDELPPDIVGQFICLLGEHLGKKKIWKTCTFTEVQTWLTFPNLTNGEIYLCTIEFPLLDCNENGPELWEFKKCFAPECNEPLSNVVRMLVELTAV